MKDPLSGKEVSGFSPGSPKFLFLTRFHSQNSWTGAYAAVTLPDPPRPLEVTLTALVPHCCPTLLQFACAGAGSRWSGGLCISGAPAPAPSGSRDETLPSRGMQRGGEVPTAPSRTKV